MTITQYLQNLNTLFITGNAREHSYRGDLQVLLSTLLPDILVTNEPARVECGAPDYVLTRKDVPVGYIEAKDIGVDMDSKTLKEQFDRYRNGLSNLIITDYLEFRFYKEGELVTKIRIGSVDSGKIVPHTEQFDHFTTLIENFAQTISQSIKSPTKLAKMMAGKARLMANIIEQSLDQDDEIEKRSPLKSQMLSFQQMLIHDIDNKAFSDIYAQTIAYGMFAARYHDPTLPTFSRMEAAELIPKSNPFLRKLFQDIAGFDLDSRLVWIVDELVHIFLASDVAQIMKNFGKSTKQEDPVVHFYETFLGEYNPALRKARGVWYTPEPVVNFIVRAVDDILKTEFNLPQGLADTSKTKVKVDYFGKKIEKEVHKVQILDPATGTGTFLAEVVKHIYKKFEGQQGIWSKYVTNDLIPRLNGFELLMASYAMAHLKMDMLLTETGYKPTDDQRFKIFLTNSLEEAHQDTGTLFSSWLSDESNQANEVKRDTPVMCIIGNPPYAVSSTNKSEWIQNLISDYKKDLNEKKINLDDDYIKFIRYGQHFIDKNGEGVLAYISNNSFIDGITHRRMRKNLLQSFDKIFIIDLHGSTKKNEIAFDGSKDENVFDIQQGVSINLFVKNNLKSTRELGDIFHFDIYGNREIKYRILNESNLQNINFKKLSYESPYYFFVPKQLSDKEYQSWISLNEIFINVNNGIKTDRDSLFIGDTKSIIEDRFMTLLSGEFSQSFVNKYRVVDSGSFKITERIKSKKFNPHFIKKILYRPFDIRYIYYDPQIVSRPAQKVMKHMLNENISILCCRQQSTYDFQHIFVSKILSEVCTVSLQTKETTYTFPLYTYPNDNLENLLNFSTTRTPNLNMDIVNAIAQQTGMYFSPEEFDLEKSTVETNMFTPLNLLDYIYAVLHSPTYREKYKEFLKIDFPRVPYPKNQKVFYDLVDLGGQLRQIHLLESPVVEKYITGYPEDGDNVVAKPVYKNGNVYINDTQYFSNVPEVAWNFYIGGYQPAQKWLKDRKDRELSYEDILHYQKIIVALFETDRLMKAIDEVEFME